jgi:phosphatidylglycerophosphate synthase
MEPIQVVIQPQMAFKEAKRIQQSFVTKAEKRALIWLAERVPDRVNSDHLTALGAFGMFAAGASYAFARYSQYGLLLGCLFLAINWLGDSLDGTLARYRGRLRPRYGFYVDHALDCFGAAALLFGMGFSGYISPLIALTLLIAYLLLSCEVFLATYALGRFEMSYLKFGPTELRILLCIANLYLFFSPSVHPFGLRLTLFELGSVIGAVGMTAIAVTSFIRHARTLYNEERLA